MIAAAAVAVALLLPPSDTLAREVGNLFQGWHRPDSPGAAVLVMQGGQTLHSAGYGMAELAHGVPIRPHTVFDIASVSKQFGAYAVALLEAEGRLSVDDPVHRHLPELPDFGHPITLRHLVHHVSGIRDWPGTLQMAGWDYQDVMSFEQILRMAEHQQELNFPPGSEYAYSNTGYNLLAEVVARVSGQSFRAFTEERIFHPLGMTRTHFQDDAWEVTPDAATSYRRGADGVYRTVVNQLTALGSSSLQSTVEDLGRWAHFLNDPHGRVPAGRPGMAQAALRLQERGILTSGDTIPYAWGQSLSRYRGVERWSHTGSWAGFRTVLLRYPGPDLTVVVLANTADMNPSQIADLLTDLYLADVLEPVAEEAPATAAAGGAGGGAGEGEGWNPTPRELEAYAGAYWSEELQTGYLLGVEGGTLVARHFRTGNRAFRPVELDRFNAPTFGEVIFLREEGGDGAVTAFTANQPRITGLRFQRTPSGVLPRPPG